MLEATEREQIQAALERYGGDAQAASVDALKIVQAQRGWVSDETLAELAQVLDLSTVDLDSVATFYNLIFRRPVGRNVILLCDSVSCWLTGYEPVCAALRQRLGIGFGETTKDQRFTLLPTVCLGDCDHGPVMMVNDDLHRNLVPEQLEGVLERYR